MKLRLGKTQLLTKGIGRREVQNQVSLFLAHHMPLINKEMLTRYSQG